MNRKVTEQTKEELRKEERYRSKTDELKRERDAACAAGQQSAWFEKTLVNWLETRHDRQCCRCSGGAEEELAYLDCLQEHIPPELRDEDYVELLLRVKEKTYAEHIPACVVLLTRDVLERKLYLDRNAKHVKTLLDWCAKQVTGKPDTGVIFQRGQEEAETGIQFFADSIVLGGEVKHQETISELEKSILLIAGTEVIGKCVRNRMLVRERAEDYMDYALSHGDRSILPVLIALKYKEEQ